jgi:hypothetical protein
MASPIQLKLQGLPSSDALDDACVEIQQKLAENGSRLAQLNWPIMRNAAMNSLGKALGELDIMDSLASAWCTAVELQELAKKTLHAPGEEPLALAKHEPSVALHPVVKIKCGPVEFPALTFEVKLGASVDSAVLIVAGGKLTAIETGTFKPFAELSYGEHELKKLAGDEVSITGRYTLPGGGVTIPCDAPIETS